MSFFNRLKDLFQAAPTPEPAPAAPAIPQPSRPIPGWTGPDTLDPELAAHVVALMEAVTAPSFSEPTWDDPTFTTPLAALEQARAWSDLVEILRRALVVLRDHPDLMRRLALVYMETWDHPSAEALWRRRAELNLGVAEAYAQLGELCERQDRPAEAAAWFQRALAVDLHHPGVWQRADALKDHLPMPRRAAATVGGVDAHDTALGLRPPDGFELRHPLGRGGYGTVYLARDTRLHRDVAIKFLHPHLTQDPHRTRAFFEEARLVARLAIPGVVRIYDLNPDDKLLVMEYLTRGTLRDRLASGRPLAPRAAVRVASSLLRTLAALHAQGFVHRDLKPENLLFRSDGATVLGDFGVAALEADAAHTRAAGTAAYMAPEQRRPDAHTVDRRADLYATGLLLVEMLAGALPAASPHAVTPPDALIGLLPSRWRTIFTPLLRSLLHPDPQHRLADAHRAWRDLQDLRRQLVTWEQGDDLLDELERLAALGGPGPESDAFLDLVRREIGR